MLPLLGMLTKFDGWRYEKEWRLFQETPEIASGGKKEAPTPSRVFLGARFDTSTGKDLLGICEGKNVPISCMHLAADKFQLTEEALQG
jgi:hypothetical protein